jgi:hypothetical protein
MWVYLDNTMNRPTQADRILTVLREVRLNGDGWVSARYMIQSMLLSQAYARIFELERREGLDGQLLYVIEHSIFKDEVGFVSHRLIVDRELEPAQAELKF